MIRVTLPGEHLSPNCGHHCGVRSTADEGTLTFIGHCACPECNCVYAVIDVVVDPAQPKGAITVVDKTWTKTMEFRTPMCESWKPPACYQSAIGAWVHGPGCPHDP